MSAIMAATSGTERMERAPSTTPVLLRRLRAALVVLTLLTGGMALLLTNRAHAVISSAGEHTASAIMQAYAAHEALADADSQAVETIPLGAGPSGEYQDDIAAAEQGLEQVAENNAAGAAGSRALLLIEGLLTAYTGLVEQADAHYRMQVSGEGGVGVEYLWSASELMHQQILGGTKNDKLDDSLVDLQSAEQSTLTAQRSSPWASPWLFAVWMITAIALLGTLVTAQLQFYLRLRRVLSKYLTMAGAALIGLCLVTGHVIAADRAFDSAQSGPLATVAALQAAQTARTDQQGQSELSKLVSGACAQCSTERNEADALAKSDATALTDARPAVAEDHCPMSRIPGCVTDQQSTYDADAIAAEAGYARSLLLIAALTALLVLLTFLGFRRHLDEYRYRWSA
jgi:hypothetical protein